MSTIIEQGSILSLDVPTGSHHRLKISPDDWRSIKSLIACPTPRFLSGLGKRSTNLIERQSSGESSNFQTVGSDPVRRVRLERVLNLA